MKAVDRYDPERGSFTAYAVVTMVGELKRHFRDRTWGTHVPRGLRDLSVVVGTGDFGAHPRVVPLTDAR